MKTNMKEQLSVFVSDNAMTDIFQFPNANIDVNLIKAIMINEIVPANPADDFYSDNIASNYLKSALSLFAKAGFEAHSIEDIVKAGIYIANAVKIPKTDTTISKEMIEKCVPILEYEIGLFPNLKVIMLMGDVAKKTFNIITKAKSKKNAIPAISTYKLRNSELYYENIRIFPSYIMTGGNILIEKSKVEMASEDIIKMLTIIRSH